MKAQSVLIGAAVVLVAVVVVEESRINALRKQLAALPPAAAATQRPHHDASPAAPSSRENPALATKNPRPAEDPAATANPKAVRSTVESLRKITENPAAKSIINEAHKAMAGLWYGDLIKQLDLTQSESEHFLALIAATMADQQEFGTKMMGAKDEAARADFAQQLKQKMAAHETAMREFLNNEQDFKTFEAYSERIPERQQLVGIRLSMKEVADPLTPEQETQLIDAMHAARAEAMPAERWGQDQAANFLDAGAEARFEADWDAMQKSLREGVGGLLDAKQQEAFFQYQGQVKEMQLGSIRMARKLFEEGNPNQTPR